MDKVFQFNFLACDYLWYLYGCFNFILTNAMRGTIVFPVQLKAKKSCEMQQSTKVSNRIADF